MRDYQLVLSNLHVNALKEKGLKFIQRGGVEDEPLLIPADSKQILVDEDNFISLLTDEGNIFGESFPKGRIVYDRD